MAERKNITTFSIETQHSVTQEYLTQHNDTLLNDTQHKILCIRYSAYYKIREVSRINPNLLLSLFSQKHLNIKN
jgi:hypothetical protein